MYTYEYAMHTYACVIFDMYQKNEKKTLLSGVWPPRLTQTPRTHESRTPHIHESRSPHIHKSKTPHTAAQIDTCVCVHTYTYTHMHMYFICFRMIRQKSELLCKSTQSFMCMCLRTCASTHVVYTGGQD